MARRTIRSSNTSDKWTWGIQTFDSRADAEEAILDSIATDEGWGDDGIVTDPDGNEYEIDVQVTLVRKLTGEEDY